MSKEQNTGTSVPLSEWLESLTTDGMQGWDMLPDIGLYMDQVLTLVDRQLSVYSGSEDTRILTSAMVNNYIKDGLLPRAKAKKYAPEHLAILLMIATLKQVMSIRDIRRLLDLEEDPDKTRAFFSRFLAFQEASFSDTRDLIRRHGLPDEAEKPDRSAGQLRDLALQLAIEARTRVLASKLVLDMVDELTREEEHEPPAVSPKKAAKKNATATDRNGKTKKQDSK